VKLRKIVSLALFVTGSLLLITSVILYISPHGRVAYWAGWTLWGFSKDDWTALHTNLGLLFVIAGALHTWLNWRPITIYLKNKSRQLVLFTGEFTVAVAVTILALVLTSLAMPPMQWVQDINEVLKDASSERYGEPPYGHAELSTLQTLTRRLDINLELATERLRDAGYEFDGPGTTIIEIADAHGVTPQVVFEAMQPSAEGGSSAPAVMPSIPTPGTGRKELAAFCEEYEIDLAEVLELLAGHDIEASGEETLKDIADRHGTSPDELYEIIRVSRQ
jgi:hypothetical protein